MSADSASTEDLGDTEVGLQVGHSRNFTLSPETTDCDSNCGDLDSEVSLLLMDNEIAEQQVVQGRLMLCNYNILFIRNCLSYAFCALRGR